MTFDNIGYASRRGFGGACARFLQLELSKEKDAGASELREDEADDDGRERYRRKSRPGARGAKGSPRKIFEDSTQQQQHSAMLESAFMEWLEKDGGTFVRRNKVDADVDFGLAENVSDEIDYDLFDAITGSDEDITPALRVTCDENANPGFDFDFPREFAIAQKRRSSIEFQTWLQSVSNLSSDDNSGSSDEVQ